MQKHQKNLNKTIQKLRKNFIENPSKHWIALFAISTLTLVEITWLNEIGNELLFITIWIILQRSLKLPKSYSLMIGVIFGVFAIPISYIKPGSLTLEKIGNYTIILLLIFGIQEFMQYEKK